MAVFAETIASVSPLLPVVVFAAEVTVVTLSTIRIIFVSRGMKGLASTLGFFEVSIWLFAIGQIMQNLTDVGCYLGFAAGFTMGNYLGIIIEKKLAIGTVVLRAISNRNVGGLVNQLKLAGYGVTSMDAEGTHGPVKIVFTVLKRKHLPHAVGLVQAFDSKAFYSVDEIKEASAGVFPSQENQARVGLKYLLRMASTAPRVARPTQLAAMCDGPPREPQ